MLEQFPVHPTLPASDLERARGWYEEKLGFIPKHEDPGGLWYECAEGTWLLVTRSAGAGTAQNTAASFTVRDIESVMHELRGRGVVFESYDLPDFKTVHGLLGWAATRPPGSRTARATSSRSASRRPSRGPLPKCVGRRP